MNFQDSIITALVITAMLILCVICTLNIITNEYAYVGQINFSTYLYRNKETNQLYYDDHKWYQVDNYDKYLTPVIEEDGTPLYLDEYQQMSILNK